MIILYILAAIILIFIYLIFAAAMQVFFTINSQDEDFKIIMLWLYPLLKAVVTLENENIVLKVYLFKKQLLKKELMHKDGKSTKRHFDLRLLKEVQPWDIHLNAAYGFRDPFFTGIACGVINIAAGCLDTASLEHSPDFAADTNYININAGARINPGTALVNIYRAYINN